jgi:hypothetical protein
MSVQPCKTFNNAVSNPSKMPANALNQVNACIDANNKLIASRADCITIASDKNSKFRMNLLEPSLNYCKSGTNATTDPFCQNLLPQQVGNISGFASNNEHSGFRAEQDKCEFMNIFLILILICLLVAITNKYSDKIISHNLLTCRSHYK